MAIEVRPRPDVSRVDYDVTVNWLRVFPENPRTYRVTYQPGDNHRPEVSSCECGKLTSANGRFRPCEHVQAVIEFRRSAEG